MGNMSYCRFENTAHDLRDCLDAVQRGEANDLSNFEISGLTNIMDMAHELIEIEDEIVELLNRLKEQV